MAPQQDGYDSPEDAALAGWDSTPSAHAHIISVEVVGDRAQVVIATEGDPDGDHDWAYCVRQERRWHEALSGSGHYGGPMREVDRVVPEVCPS
jgi:hypothetical protein